MLLMVYLQVRITVLYKDSGMVYLLTFCIEHLSNSMEEFKIIDSAIHAKQQRVPTNVLAGQDS